MVVMVSDVAWIRRGVAKSTPDKVKLDVEQLKELIESEVAETSDNEDEETSDCDAEMVAEDGEQGEKKLKKKVGLRGSGERDNEYASDDEGMKGVEKYLKDYDKTDDQGGPTMKGIAAFASNMDDPYITQQNDSDEEEEKNDFLIKPDDNMVAVAKIDNEDYTLEVYIYNEKNDDWYVHHDYLLEAPPLCLEPLQYDPGNEQEEGKGNLLAVGTMESTINIWDLDIVNAIEPVVTLGGKYGQKKRSKRDGSAQGHRDAVLCLSWNKLTKHVMASGGADRTVVLWDLDQAKAAQIVPNFDAEIQSIHWHPAESTIFIAGTMGGSVSVTDCRNVEAATPAKWNFEGQIEKVLWDHFNPFCAFIASDDGYLRYVDTRNSSVPVFEARGHEGGCSAVALSQHTRGLLTTVGIDQQVAVWKVGNNALTKVHAETFSLGPLHSVSFCPESPTIIAIGGEGNNLIRIVDLATMEPVIAAFSA